MSAILKESLLVSSADDELLLAEKLKWRGFPLDQRLSFMAKEMFVMYPEFLKVAKEIKRRMHRCIVEDKGVGMLCLVPSGGGKTHLCKFLKSRWPENHDGAVRKIPVIAFNIPPSPTPRSMGQSLIKSMGDPAWKNGSALFLLDRAIDLISAVETTVICIDNVQDIPEKRGIKGIEHVGNWIRDLIDGTGRLVVMLGTPAASAVVSANSQLRRRTSARSNIDYFMGNASQQISRTKRFLYELDKVLPLAELSNLAEPERMRKILWATNGIQDYIFKIVSEAVSAAVTDGREHLREVDFQIAFDMVFHDAGEGLNPFCDGGPDRALDKEGEIFHEWFDNSNPNPAI